MGKSYLALDFGASSGRAIIGTIANGKLTLKEIHRFPNGPVERDGSFFWDIERLFKETLKGIKKAAKACPNLQGIAVDTWGVDYVLLKKDGKFLRDPYSYRDPRTGGVPEKISKKISDKAIYSKTGIQSMLFNSVYQLYAHKAAYPADLKGTKILLIPDAINYMLCGRIACELTEASTTQILNAKTKKWDDNIIKALGFDKALFPQVAKPCTKAGMLRPDLAKELGCKQIPVFFAGSHDTASAAAAVPAKKDTKWAFLSLGTWALFGVESKKAVLTETARKAGFTNECGLDGKTLFMSNIMGTWLLQETKRVWTEKGRKVSFPDMAKMAAGSECCKYFINPNDNMFYSPCDMPAKIREFLARTGQGKDVSDSEVVRCIYDSLAVRFRLQLGHMESILGTKFQYLHVIGGGCQDKFFLQLIADATGLVVVAGPVEATAAGNIAAQAVASGEFKSLSSAREMVRRSFGLEIYRPTKGRFSPSHIAKFKTTG